MTSLAVSYVSFGSYTFPLGTKVKSRDASTDIEETKMLGLDGSIAPAGVLAAQIISLDIDIGGAGDFDPASTPTDIIYLESMDDLNNALNNLFYQLEQGYQSLELGFTPARAIQAQKRKFNPAYLDGSGRRHSTVSMEFLAPDPRWLSVATHTITATGTATNNGNMLSYPVITYTQTGGAASTAPTVQVNPGGTSGVYVSLTLALPILGLPTYMQAGDVLVINCDPRRRAQGLIYTPAATGIPINALPALGTTGIVNTIGNDATFPYFIPGNNTVTLAGANGIACVWSDAFAL